MWFVLTRSVGLQEDYLRNRSRWLWNKAKVIILFVVRLNKERIDADKGNCECQPCSCERGECVDCDKHCGSAFHKRNHKAWKKSRRCAAELSEDDKQTLSKALHSDCRLGFKGGCPKHAEPAPAEGVLKV